MTEVIQHLINALSLGGLYALAAIGIALIFGVMRLINFAHGELILIGGYLLLWLSGAPTVVLIIATLAAIAALAMAMERVAFRPVREANMATLLITSFALSALIQNLLILFVGSRPKSASVLPGLGQPVSIGDIDITKIDLVTVAASLLLLAAVGLFLNRTLTGMQIRAATENFGMARMLGVNGNRVIAVAFAISGGLAACVSILLVARTGNLFPTLGLEPAIFGFVATIIGGIGSLRGAVAGGFLLGALQVALQVVLPEELRPYRDAFVFALVIAVLLIRPQGLIPTKLVLERV